MKRAVEYLGLSAAIMIMLAAVLTYLAPHFGWRVNAVLTGSMEPYLKVGSLVVTRPVDPGDVEMGDVIVFRPVTVGENLISHRVIGIKKPARYICTFISRLSRPGNRIFCPKACYIIKFYSISGTAICPVVFIEMQ